ncbi:hypothetical protein [Cetobacterium sp.]|uniref:hypothetical protein n=1 Tax=Cetobacterium sp. TaxID=2071632 RepID=UPI003EE81D0D
MKVNINTNHIRIYKLLNFLPNKDIDFICQFLKMNRQNVILYIKQIYYFLETKKQSNLLSDMIKELSENKNIFNILKQNQVFIKEDRIFYIILILLKYSDLGLTLNLNTLSSNFNISRRTLNDDLIAVKKALQFYNLEIFSIPSKGVNISGSSDNIKNCFLSYLFKFFVEFEEIPPLMAKNFLGVFKENLSVKIINDIDYFIYTFDLDLFANNKKLLKCIYIVYFSNSYKKRINCLSLEDFKKYFHNIFPQKNIEKVYSFLKSSSLGDFPLKYIHVFILTLKFCNGTLREDGISLKKECNLIKDIFINVTTQNISYDIFFEKFAHRINIANKKSSFLFMSDLSFLSLNLDYKIKHDCYCIFTELRKIYFNIQFSNVIYLYLWSLNKINLTESSTTIVVFKDLPKFLQPIIKNLFLLKENIQISNFVRYTELDTYLLQEEPSLVITFENLSINSNYPFIKYYSLPL